MVGARRPGRPWRRPRDGMALHHLGDPCYGRPPGGMTDRLSGQPLSPSTMHAVIESRVGTAPESTAVVERGRTCSYGALNAAANRWARRLRRSGGGPEALVALCAERSTELVVGVLAVVKAGGGYGPLDPDHPSERLRDMLDGCGAGVPLTQERPRGPLPAFSGGGAWLRP